MLRHRPSSCWILTLLTMMCLVVPNVVRAGRGDKAGTASASQLLIPIGGRSIAMAGSSLALVGGVEALYWNPAGIMRAGKGTNVMFSHMSYLADIGVDYVGFTSGLGDVARFGLSLKTLSIGDVAVTTEDFPDGTGEMTSPTFLVLGGTLARNISDRITVGVTAQYVYEKMALVSSTGLAFSAGVQYVGLGGIEGLGVGVVLRNLGPGMKFDGPGLVRNADITDGLRGSSAVTIAAKKSDLPSTIEIGLGYTAPVGEEGVLNFAATFENNNFADDEYKLGLESVLRKTVFVRFGYAFSPTDGDRDYIYGPSAGIGIQTELSGTVINVDYAYRSVKYFLGNHLFSVGIDF